MRSLVVMGRISLFRRHTAADLSGSPEVSVEVNVKPLSASQAVLDGRVILPCAPSTVFGSVQPCNLDVCLSRHLARECVDAARAQRASIAARGGGNDVGSRSFASAVLPGRRPVPLAWLADRTRASAESKKADPQSRPAIVAAQGS
jgi:hypothetical protein